MALSVLAGLPKSYDVAVGVLQFANVLKLDDILPKLLQVEQRVHEQEEAELNASKIQIFGANTGAKKCYRCGKTGHFKANCPDRNSVCLYCNKKGHWIVSCRKRQQDEQDDDKETIHL